MATGLHGHRIGAALERSAVAELIGTFILVLTIVTTAVSAALATPIAGPAFSSATVPLAGAVLAALAAWGIDGSRARSQAALGATAPATGVSGLRVLLVEALVTFVLVLVVVAVATDDRVSRAGAALAIGAALGVAILISGPITGAGVNPARSLGPMLVAGQWTGWWAYIAGPLIGGIAAALLWPLRPASPAPATPATVGASARS
ncbi:aquaporin [Actinoplanes sp. NPDC000266]